MVRLYGIFSNKKQPTSTFFVFFISMDIFHIFRFYAILIIFDNSSLQFFASSNDLHDDGSLESIMQSCPVNDDMDVRYSLNQVDKRSLLSKTTIGKSYKLSVFCGIMRVAALGRSVQRN